MPKIQFLIQTAIAASVGFATLTYASPETANRVLGMFRENTVGWTAKACEENPETCLLSRDKQLLKLEDSVEFNVRGLQQELTKLQNLVIEREQLVNKNTELLDKGKRALSNFEGSPERNIRFEGRVYANFNTLKNQIQLLFEEKNTLDETMRQSRMLRQQVHERADMLRIRLGEIRMERAKIPSQLALIRSGNALKEFSSHLATMDTLITKAEIGLKETNATIVTTEDFTKKGNIQGGLRNNEAFESFLAK